MRKDLILMFSCAVALLGCKGNTADSGGDKLAKERAELMEPETAAGGNRPSEGEIANWKKAAMGNNAEAAFRLYAYYLTEGDARTANPWLDQAANNGNCQAIEIMIEKHSFGATEKSPERRDYWIRKRDQCRK